MLAILALCLATDPDLVDLHQEESDMDSAAKAEKQKFADDAAWDPLSSVTEGELKQERKKLLAAHDLPVYSEINDEVRAETSSFIQTKDAPDDGFAKVEAKLKALEEKMKADAAKFEAEAKAPASSFVQTKDAPDDADLAELEKKQSGFATDTLKEMEKDAEKIKDKLKAVAGASKFEATAPAPASSFVQTSGQGKTLGKRAKKWDSPLVQEASVFAGLSGDGASLVADGASLPPMTPGSDDEELRTAPYTGNPLSDPMPSHWTAHDELRSEEDQMSADLSSLADTHKPAAMDPAAELAATFERPDGTVRPIESWLEEKELRRH